MCGLLRATEHIHDAQRAVSWGPTPNLFSKAPEQVNATMLLIQNNKKWSCHVYSWGEDPQVMQQSKFTGTVTEVYEAQKHMSIVFTLCIAYLSSVWSLLCQLLPYKVLDSASNWFIGPLKVWLHQILDTASHIYCLWWVPPKSMCGFNSSINLPV